jgi:hypothetical protein
LIRTTPDARFPGENGEDFSMKFPAHPPSPSLSLLPPFALLGDRRYHGKEEEEPDSKGVLHCPKGDGGWGDRQVERI